LISFFTALDAFFEGSSGGGNFRIVLLGILSIYPVAVYIKTLVLYL
jgi:hypothetical protein